MARKLTRDEEIALMESASERAEQNVRRYLSVPIIRDTLRATTKSDKAYKASVSSVRIKASC